jgi:class 3 adenylate cyclase
MPVSAIPRPPLLSFGLKLTLAMVLMVAGICLAVLFVMRGLEDRYREFVTPLFQQQVDLFFKNQDNRLTAARDALQNTAVTRNVRLLAALEAGDVSRLYSDLDFQLGPVLARFANSSDAANSGAFYRFFTADGHDLPPTNPDGGSGQVPGLDEKDLADALYPFARLAAAPGDSDRTAVGYAAFTPQGNPQVYNIVTAKITDPYDGSLAGSLVFGAPLDPNRDFERGRAPLQNGLLLDGRLVLGSLPPTLAAQLNDLLKHNPEARADTGVQIDVNGISNLVFFRELSQEGSGLPPAWHVSLYSLEDLQNLTAQITNWMAGIILVTLLVGVLLAIFTSRRLTRPILELVQATEAVGRGDFNTRVAVHSRDEIGRLGASFNDMTADLALKEKYRNVLDRVTDHDVAERLLNGQLSLGGELREVSILFCDIRGFTYLTENMDPARVVDILNEHMTALNRIVHRHRGVVDKFVGDSLMALFGAPKSYGHDARDAAACALALVAERQRLNTQTARAINIGVGIATGSVLAGCMGSADRLNYTVLGNRVNLAARLCARAQPCEVLIDGATRAALPQNIEVEALEPLTLKGFSQPIPVFRLHASSLAAIV